MKHVKLFEQFVKESVNEGVEEKLAKEVAKLIGTKLDPESFYEYLQDYSKDKPNGEYGFDEDQLDTLIDAFDYIFQDGLGMTNLNTSTVKSSKLYKAYIKESVESVNEAAGLPSHARNLSRKLKAHWLPDTDKPWLPGADSKGIYFLADGPDRYQTNKGQTITIDLSVRTGEYTVIDKKDNVIYQGGDPYAVAKLIESKDDVIDETK